MEKFEFYNPIRVVFRPGEVKRVGTEAKALGKTALVVSSKDHAFFSDLLSRVEKDLAAAGVKPVSFYEVTANPTIEQVEAGVRAAKAARTNLMGAATVAWNGWTNPGCASTTPMHLVAHPISAHFHVTHGATLAIVMHAWMRRFCKNPLPRYAQFGERVFGMSAKGKDPEKFALEVIDRFESWRKGLGVQTMLPELGVGKDKIDMLMDDIVRVSFGADGKLGARVPASKDDVRAILQLAL